MATKNPVTLEELSEWMTGKARRSSGCAGLTVTVQYKLPKPDHQGKNWSDALLIHTGECAIEDAMNAISNAQRDAIERFHVA